MTTAPGRTRGNAIPETALVMSLFLMMLYGIVQYAVLGYNEVSADGATFVGAHDTVAQYGGPTSSNSSYTQKVINAVFSGLHGATVSTVANNGSYETDITETNTNTGLSSLLPTTLTTVSREIESSASTANVNTQIGSCATGATTLVNGTTTVTGPPVNLLQGAVSSSGLFQTVNAGGGEVIDLNSGTITAHLAAVQTIDSDFTLVAGELQQLSNVVNPPGLGALLTPALVPVSNVLSVGIDPVLSTALTGKLTQNSLNAATSTISAQTSLLVPAVQAVINPLLYGGNVTVSLGGASGSVTTTNGLLGGPSGGTIMMLNGAEQTLQSIDAAAPLHC